MARGEGGSVMKIDTMGTIYCGFCSTEIEGVITDTMERPDLIGEVCFECEMPVF